MSDREMLELAAKAAGLRVGIEPDRKERGRYDLYWSRVHSQLVWHNKSTGSEYPEPLFWNPLAGDGDALRLMVKLGETGFFRLNFGVGAVSAENPAVKPLPILYACEDMEELGGAAATRRAIVRAAAEIGMQMP